MNVVFLEPCFPYDQREFVRALHAVGARVTGIGEGPIEALSETLKSQMVGYEQVGSVCDEAAMLAGYLAAGFSQTGKIGTYGGQQFPATIQFAAHFMFMAANSAAAAYARSSNTSPVSR